MNALRALAAALLVVLGLAVPALAQSIPTPKGYVTDETGLVGTADRTAIEETLGRFESESAVHIAVVLVESLQGVPPAAYIEQLWNHWGVGRDGAGVILLLAPRDGAAWIEFSRNLKGRLTDEDCAYILETELKPEMLQGLVSAGVRRTTTALVKRLTEAAERYRVAHPPRAGGEEDSSLTPVLCVGLVLIGLVLASLAGAKVSKASKAKPFRR